jgi:hypothetical protein
VTLKNRASKEDAPIMLKYALESLPELLGDADYELIKKAIEFNFHRTTPDSEGVQLRKRLKEIIRDREAREEYSRTHGSLLPVYRDQSSLPPNMEQTGYFVPNHGIVM